jgi:HNH endonuclease
MTGTSGMDALFTPALPPPATISQALVWLHATQGFLRLSVPKDGRPYGPGYFAKRDWLGALKWENRRVSVRLGRMTTCVGCGSPMPEGSTGDHIVPLSKGGPSGAQNYLPLCRSCNASKGARDLLEWWLGRGRDVGELPLDVIVAYVRLTYCWYRDRGELDAAPPFYLATAAVRYLDQLPSSAHRGAVQKLAASAWPR